MPTTFVGSMPWPDRVWKPPGVPRIPRNAAARTLGGRAAIVTFSVCCSPASKLSAVHGGTSKCSRVRSRFPENKHDRFLPFLAPNGFSGCSCTLWDATVVCHCLTWGKLSSGTMPPPRQAVRVPGDSRSRPMSTAWNRGSSCSRETLSDSKQWHTSKSVTFQT